MNSNASVIQRFRGYVVLEIRGGHLEVLLNRLTAQRIAVWDVRLTGSGGGLLSIGVPDFFRLRPLLRETGCRTRVKMRYGFPFMLDKLERRKFFAAGILMFIAGIYLLSSLVWQVRVEGNEKLPQDQVLQAAKAEGIYKFQWKRRLKEPAELSRSLQRQLPAAAWIGVEFQGTHVVIKIVEAVIPDTPPLMNPRHLVASKNAMVTEMFAEKGKPAVKTNTYVRKGDILISGILGDETHQQTVVAEGKVKGLVWYKPVVEVPLTQRYKVYTGETKNRSYLVTGSRGVQVTGYGKLPFEQYETISERKSLRWRDYSLPVGWLSERLMEVSFAEIPISQEEARSIGLEQAKGQILVEAGPESRVVSEKILHEKAENGKVYMEVLLEVEELIAVELPIVP